MSFLFFNQYPVIETGVLPLAQWELVKTGYGRNVEKVIEYHKNAKVAVRGGHILLRLLTSINVPKSLDVERYYANVDEMALHTAGVLGMSSYMKTGKMFNGIFYSKDQDELLLAVDEPFNPYEVDRNWRDTCAVYPILHPKSDLGIQLPNGRAYSAEAGLSIIVVHPAKLAVQYRAYVNHQQTLPAEDRRGMAAFVGAYVLPNMIKKSVELNFFNRLVNRFNAADSIDNEPFSRPIIALSDYTYYIDTVIDHILLNLTRVPPSFVAIMQNIPAYFSRDMLESLLLPDTPPTRQCDWILNLSRLKACNFLMNVVPQSESRNRQFIQQWRRSINLYDTDGVLMEIFTKEQLVEIQFIIDRIEAAA